MNIDEIFSKGASYLISEKGYEDYISGKDVTLGRPVGDDTVVWVAPSAEIDEAIIKTNGNPRELETLLGLPENSLGDTPVRVNIDNIDGLDIRIPDASTPGANPNFIPGGSTSGGITERVIYNCPNPDVNHNIGEIGNTNSINGIPTKQLNNLYNSLGRDSECLRFIHCIYYTSAARGFIRVLFKIPLNTFIIVRFRLWHLLMKS